MSTETVLPNYRKVSNGYVRAGDAIQFSNGETHLVSDYGDTFYLELVWVIKKQGGTVWRPKNQEAA